VGIGWAYRGHRVGIGWAYRGHRVDYMCFGCALGMLRMCFKNSWAWSEFSLVCSCLEQYL